MTRTRILAALLVVVGVAFIVVGIIGCSSVEPRNVNDACEPYGGVLSMDWHGGTFVCADKIAREF
jgi:hypothetical protein